MSGQRSTARGQGLHRHCDEGVLVAIVLLAAGMRLWQLSQNGFGRQYYAAGVLSMTESWRNFAYNAFDPAGFVSIDKPPLAIWAQVASAKLFGFSGWSVLLPQALAGIAAVALIYLLVRRVWGSGAAAIAALVLALMPAAVAVDRSNNTESVLIVVLLGAVYAGARAAEAGSLRWLCAAMALVGLGFNVKMGAALVIAPVIALTYWLATRQRSWIVGLSHQATAGAVLLVVSLSWAMAFDLTPPDKRPYAGSTRNNSMLELALVHNGLSRLAAIGRPVVREASAVASAKPKPVLTDQSPTGFQRLFRPLAAAQFAWLLPLAILGLVGAWATAWRERSSNRECVAASLWTGWLAAYWLVLSYAGGSVHTYYIAILGPPMAVLAGLGAWQLIDRWRRSLLSAVALAAVAAVTAFWQAIILIGNGAPALGTTPGLVAAVSMALIILGILWSVLAARSRGSERPVLPAALAMAPLLALPALAAASVVIAKPNVAVPVADIARLTRDAGPASPRQALRDAYRKMNRERLLAFLKAHRNRETFIVAVPNAVVAAPLILATRQPVMAMGGYLGDDPILTPGRLARLRDEGKLRFVLLGGFTLAPDKQKAALAGIARWVRANGRPVAPEQWSIRRRAAPATSTIRYGNGWMTVERRELYDLGAR